MYTVLVQLFFVLNLTKYITDYKIGISFFLRKELDFFTLLGLEVHCYLLFAFSSFEYIHFAIQCLYDGVQSFLKVQRVLAFNKFWSFEKITLIKIGTVCMSSDTNCPIYGVCITILTIQQKLLLQRWAPVGKEAGKSPNWQIISDTHSVNISEIRSSGI